MCFSVQLSRWYGSYDCGGRLILSGAGTNDERRLGSLWIMQAATADVADVADAADAESLFLSIALSLPYGHYSRRMTMIKQRESLFLTGLRIRRGKRPNAHQGWSNRINWQPWARGSFQLAGLAVIILEDVTWFSLGRLESNWSRIRTILALSTFHPSEASEPSQLKSNILCL